MRCAEKEVMVFPGYKTGSIQVSFWETFKSFKIPLSFSVAAVIDQ